MCYLKMFYPCCLMVSSKHMQIWAADTVISYWLCMDFSLFRVILLFHLFLFGELCSVYDNGGAQNEMNQWINFHILDVKQRFIECMLMNVCLLRSDDIRRLKWPYTQLSKFASQWLLLNSVFSVRHKKPSINMRAVAFRKWKVQTSEMRVVFLVLNHS